MQYNHACMHTSRHIYTDRQTTVFAAFVQHPHADLNLEEKKNIPHTIHTCMHGLGLTLYMHASG